MASRSPFTLGPSCKGAAQYEDKSKKILHGTVNRIIKSPDPSEAEKAEIVVDDAEQLYREIRVDNTVSDESGASGKLKEKAHVDVIIEADPDATTGSKSSQGS